MRAGVGSPPAWVDLYWIPLGAGSALPIVKWNGILFERLVAMRERRPACDLYHAAVEVGLAGDRYVIEMAPAWGAGSVEAEVVGTGPVGARWLGRSRYFRYQVRCWRGGTIPDLAFAVDSPRRVSEHEDRVARLLDAASSFPTATWGRDELHAGEMWNSNSLVSWLLVTAGIDLAGTSPPSGGRAPGWSAGLAIAQGRRSASMRGSGPARRTVSR